MLIAALMILLCMPAAAIAASQASYPCQAFPEVRRALADLGDPRDFKIPLEKRLAPRWALAEKYSRDIFVHQRLPDSFRHQLNLYREFDCAFALYRSKPDDPVFQYLEASLTGSFHFKNAEEMFESLIAREPGFPGRTTFSVRPCWR